MKHTFLNLAQFVHIVSISCVSMCLSEMILCGSSIKLNDPLCNGVVEYAQNWGCWNSAILFQFSTPSLMVSKKWCSWRVFKLNALKCSLFMQFTPYLLFSFVHILCVLFSFWNKKKNVLLSIYFWFWSCNVCHIGMV